MKIRIQSSNQGSALVVTLLTAVVIGISLASYLTLVSSQNVSTMRSLAWNSTVPVLESGVEEALTQLHYTGITNLTANGWSYAGGLLYRKQRTLANGASYTVVIQASEPPVVESVGYMPVPLVPGAQVGMILGGVTPLITPAASSTLVNRAVRVHTRRDGVFSKAMVADGQIDLRGNNIQTDSFDSGSTNYSSSGRYDPGKARDNGDVATNSGLVNSVNVGNADIKGHISTGPGGSVSIGPQGTVGSKAWVEGGNRGIQPGYVSDDMNVEFGPVGQPYNGSLMPAAATIATTNYNYVLGPGVQWWLPSLSMNGNQTMFIGGGVVTLYVKGDVSISGNAYIYIAPGATLKLYVAGPSADVGGSGVISTSGNAINFQYYGLDSNTSLSFQGNSAYTGTIYAPNADFTLGGGGNETYDFVGASVTKTVSMNGHYNFHYDEALARNGPLRDYIVTAWNEL
jgi:hypothetical protein